MQITAGVISIVFTILGIGLIHLELNEIKNHGFTFASLGFIFFGVLWTIGWVMMAISNIWGDGTNAISIFGFIIAN